MSVKALSYLRVSGKGQVDGDGFPRQREAIEKYAKAHKAEIIEEFRDEGVSGTKELDDRPGLSALVERIAGNGVRLVLVERADRLARDLMVNEILLGELRKMGVTVIAADSGVDLTAGDDDPTRKLIRQILAAVAEFDKSCIVLKLRAARQRARKQTGRCEGRKPYGDRPGEAEVVQRILELRRKRPNGKAMSYEAIAEALNAEGIATRYGQPWQARTVFGIVKRLRGKA